MENLNGTAILEPAGEHLASVSARASSEHARTGEAPTRSPDPVAPAAAPNGARAAEFRETAAGDATATPETEPAKRGPGRPKGSRNRVTKAAREAINDAAPHTFLIRVMEGRTFKRGDKEGARRSVSVRPTLEQSITAGMVLLRKLVPDLASTELTGADGGPIAVTRAPFVDLSATEQARHLAAALAKLVHRQTARAAEPQSREPVDVTPVDRGSVPEAGDVPRAAAEPEEPRLPRGVTVNQEGQNGRWTIRRDGRVVTFASTHEQAFETARNLKPQAGDST